ncbi:MAG: FmdB family zinc ribbon protein [Terriglobia bacterium]
MPLYEYECKKCRRRVEKIQKYSDPILTICESCGGKLERLVSSPAIRFKGSGWYVNDYAKKSSDASGNSSADSSPPTEKKETEKKATEKKEKESSKPAETAKTSPAKD